MGSPPPGYRPPPRDPTLQRQSLSARGCSVALGTASLLSAKPRAPLWPEDIPRPGKYSSGRASIAKAVGDACQQPGPNLLLEVSSNYSPTARVPMSTNPSHLLLDGYVRGSAHELRTLPGKHLHDSYLLGPPGSGHSSVLQSVLNRPDGTHADGNTVILCQLHAMTVRRAHA